MKQQLRGATIDPNDFKKDDFPILILWMCYIFTFTLTYVLNGGGGSVPGVILFSMWNRINKI